MEVVEHLHLQRVVVHGNEAVLGLDKVDADEARLMGVHCCLNSFEAQQRLGEDLLGRVAAQNLVNVADLHLAGSSGLWCSAMLKLAALRFSTSDNVAIGCHFGAQAMIKQRPSELGEIR